MDRAVLDDDQRQIRTEATEWVVRLCGRPLDAGEKLAFDHWLARSPVHREMFERASALWGDLGQLRDSAAAAVPVTPPAHPRSRMARQRPAMWGRAAALAASLLLVCGLSGLWFGNPLPTLMADHATAPGELRMVTMPDGSVAELGPASAIVVRFTAQERRINLLSGLVHFSVVPKAKAGGRPFVVEAAGGSAEALGTRFTVERQTDAVNVTVTEHDVRVSVTGDAGRPGSTVVVSPGQTVRYDAKRGLGTVLVTDLENADAWLHGRLVFDRIPLSDVVASLNRYRRGRIVVLDADLAARIVSGVFDTDDLENALGSITHSLGIKAVSVPPFVTVLH